LLEISLRCERNGFAWDAVSAVKTAAAAAAAVVDEDDDVVDIDVDVGVTVGRRGNANVAKPIKRKVAPNDR